MQPRLAVVTGASSGIGAATARHLAEAGFDVVIGARRLDRLQQVADRIDGSVRAFELDVTNDESVARFCAEVPACSVLVNNAGGALGLAPIEQADLAQWQTMYDTNVLGTLRMTRSLLPRLIDSDDGHIIVVGSIAAYEPYPGGAGYNAAKFAERALASVLRQELLGRPVRITEVDPGMVETDFSLVRFGGDAERAAQVYEGVTPLTPDDVAECITFAATRPSHVNIDTMVVLARDQAGARQVHRHPNTDA